MKETINGMTMEYDPSILSARIKRLMNSMLLNGNEFADYTGIPRSTLNRYLNERRVPKLSYIVKMAERCNVSIDWLLGYSKDQRREDQWGPEIEALVNKYALATEEDKKLVQYILGKYQLNP